MFLIHVCAIVAAGLSLMINDPSRVQRHDFFVNGEPGIRLFVREVVSNRGEQFPSKKALLLLHGARVPGVASFDLQVPGGSFAADLAERGFDVYIMDIRGYGASTRPGEMEEPPSAHPPLVRSNEVAHDINAVVDWIHLHQHVSNVALFGWATGGQWAAYYASIYPKKISALILLNSLYGRNSAHSMIGHGTDLEDPENAGHFNQKLYGAYRLNAEGSLLGAWDHSIPEQDKSTWRDPAVADAYVKAALASDPTSNKRTPPSFRSPSGAFEDSFYLAIGHQLWDASLITAPTLVVRSEKDFWSRAEDQRTLVDDLVHAQRVRSITIPGGTHFVHLDRPERGRDLLLNSICEFLLEK